MQSDVGSLSEQLEEEQRRATELEVALDERRAELEEMSGAQVAWEAVAMEAEGRMGLMSVEQQEALELWERLAALQWMKAEEQMRRMEVGRDEASLEQLEGVARGMLEQAEGDAWQWLLAGLDMAAVESQGQRKT